MKKKFPIDFTDLSSESAVRGSRGGVGNLRLRRRPIANLTENQMEDVAGGHPHTCEPTCPPTCCPTCPNTCDGPSCAASCGGTCGTCEGDDTCDPAGCWPTV